MDIKAECQKIYDEALAKVKAEVEARKIPDKDVMGAFGFFDQFKQPLAQLRFDIADIPEYKGNYKARKAGIIQKYGSSANEDLFLKIFAEAVKKGDVNIFSGFVEEAFL